MSSCGGNDPAQRRPSPGGGHWLILWNLLATLGAALGVLTFRLSAFGDFVRGHRQGLVTLAVLGSTMTAHYAVIRGAPRTWWAWGTGGEVLAVELTAARKP